MKKIILTILLIIAISCKEAKADDKQIVISKPLKKARIELYVFSPTGLNLRENPSIKAKAIKTIPFNESVEFLNESNFEEEINSIKGKWFNVKYKELTGYIFSSFLSTKSLEKIYNKSKLYYMLSVNQPNCEIDVEEYCAFTLIYDNSNKTINKFENMAKPNWHDDVNLAYYTGAGDGGGYFGSKTLINVLNKNLTPQYTVSGGYDDDQEGFRNQMVYVLDNILIFQLNEKENLLQVFKGESKENRVTLGRLLFKKEGSKINKVRLDNFDQILTFDIEKNLLNKEKFQFQFFKENLEIIY